MRTRWSPILRISSYGFCGIAGSAHVFANSGKPGLLAKIISFKPGKPGIPNRWSGRRTTGNILVSLLRSLHVGNASRHLKDFNSKPAARNDFLWGFLHAAL